MPLDVMDTLSTACGTVLDIENYNDDDRGLTATAQKYGMDCMVTGGPGHHRYKQLLVFVLDFGKL